MSTATVLAVTGLKREATILAGRGVVTVAGGGDPLALARRLGAAFNLVIAAAAERKAGTQTSRAGPGSRIGAEAPSGMKRKRPATRIVGVISIGIGGALSPDLRVGDWVVADAVIDGITAWPTDGAWRQRLRLGLLGTAPAPLTLPPLGGGSLPLPDGARHFRPSPLRGEGRVRGSEDEGSSRISVGPIAGVDQMVVDAGGKAALSRATGAVAVDMESHIAARFAAAHALPFAALRVISDTAERDLPPAVLAGMRPDGGMDVAGVLKALAADPRQLPALIRTGREAQVAFRALALLRRHDLLGGPGIGCPYLGELLLDVT